jgi:predicted Zn-dependent peptidase
VDATGRCRHAPGVMQRMKFGLFLLIALAVSFWAGAARAQSASAQSATNGVVNIPYKQYTLDNGLTVILHEDHTQPLVVLNINVNVGSRDERAKRTGFAHLFEHLMFMGTSRVPEKKFDEWMEKEGAWNNAWTSQDRTDYYDVGPSHTLPLMLWMEADRFGVLGSEIDLNKLNTQRAVVRNERRQQVENQPYEIVRLKLPGLLFPEGHPYHHPVIGSHEDLEAASVGDVRSFFDEHYVPENMSVVVAGDFDPVQVRPLVEKYFGSLPKAKTPPKRGVATKPAQLTDVVRATLRDNVSLPKVVMAWHSPAVYAPGDAELDILSEVLSEGKASRLYKALVYDRELAQTVSAYQASKSLHSHFNIEAVARPGVKLADIESAIDAELEKLRKEKVSAKELERAKNQYEAGYIARLQSLSARASMLNGYYAHHKNPGYAGADLQRYLDVTTDDVLAVAKRVFDPKRRVIIHVLPREKGEGEAK